MDQNRALQREVVPADPITERWLRLRRILVWLLRQMEPGQGQNR